MLIVVIDSGKNSIYFGGTIPEPEATVIKMGSEKKGAFSVWKPEFRKRKRPRLAAGPSSHGAHVALLTSWGYGHEKQIPHPAKERGFGMTRKAGIDDVNRASLFSIFRPN
jgi:hypothetical protein